MLFTLLASALEDARTLSGTGCLKDHQLCPGASPKPPGGHQVNASCLSPLQVRQRQRPVHRPQPPSTTPSKRWRWGDSCVPISPREHGSPPVPHPRDGLSALGTPESSLSCSATRPWAAHSLQARTKPGGQHMSRQRSQDVLPTSPLCLSAAREASISFHHPTTALEAALIPTEAREECPSAKKPRACRARRPQPGDRARPWPRDDCQSPWKEKPHLQ